MPKASPRRRFALASALALGIGAALAPAAAFASKDRFVVDLVNEPSSLDPQMQWDPDSYYVYRNIFDNLVTRDAAGQIAPQVATAWHYLSDTEVVFDIRNDITFHDGSKLTAEDVAYSVKRITDPKLGSPQLGQFDKIADAVVLSPTQVKLTTRGPYPVLLAQLVKLSVLPKAVVERVGKDAFNASPVGSGPYKFVGWQRGVAVTLARNDNYWGAKGPFPAALFRAVPDGATRVADLRSGASDLVVSLNSDQAAELKGDAGVQALVGLTERVAYMRLNTTRPPFDDPRLRLAAAYAIDREGLTDGILGGLDKPVTELLTPTAFGWVDGIAFPGYDLAKAKGLVAAAGAAGKVEVGLATAPAFDQRIVQAIQQMLVDAGFNVKIEMSDLASYLKRAQAGPATTSLLSFGRWSCACQDADGVLFPILHSSSAWSAYRNPETDKLLDDARQTRDEARRLADYRQVHEIVARDIPVVPLYQSAAIYGATRHLDWQPTANESLFLDRMRWKE